MNIGSRIKHRRELLDMSQDELAKKVGYKSRSSINKIEIDGRGLPQSKIVAFANALDTTPAYLMGWEDDDSQRTIHNSAVSFASIYNTFGYEVYLLCDTYLSLADDGKQLLIEYANFLMKRERGNDFKMMSEEEAKNAFTPNLINTYSFVSKDSVSTNEYTNSLPKLNAAHADNYEDALEELKKQEEDIMDDENF